MGHANLHARIVVGLGYGDEGKGSWVDHLVRKHGIRYVVRFNGGPQAAHHVVTRDGDFHRFSQFGSGTLVPGTNTILSRFMLVDPQYLLEEAAALEKKGVEDPLSHMIISENSPVITPFNRLLNRIQEVYRGGLRHGSCGFGIGVTQGDSEALGDRALYVRDLCRPYLAQKLKWLLQRRLSEAQCFANAENEELRTCLAQVDVDFYAALYAEFYSKVHAASEADINSLIGQNNTVFEGAQGVLLDQQYGTFPYCTRSTCTFENAETLLHNAGFTGIVERIGLLRGYGTRHGAGPFITEDSTLKLASCHNGMNEWQGRFRLGWFDAVAARYALDAVGAKVDTLALTNLDRLGGLPRIKICTGYYNTQLPFFSPEGDKMHVLPSTDLKALAQRSAAMEHILPRYAECLGWADDGASEGIARYVEMLEHQLQQPVHAISASVDDRKIYRRL